MSRSSSTDSLGSTSQLEQKYWVPAFLDQGGFKKGEYFEEWRQYLLNKNQEQLEQSLNIEPRASRFQFFSKSIIQAAFQISKLIEMPPEVRYLAIDMYDRFMMKHLFDVMDEASLDGNFERNWPDINKRLEDQAVLRLLTCIQLASKLSSNAKVISAANLQEVLKHFRMDFSKQSVLKSEIRIYRTLQYELPTVSPLTYVEMILEDLPFHEVKQDLSGFLRICVNILDIAFYQHSHIYIKLFCVKTGRFNMSRSDKNNFIKLEGDYMFLAASTVRAAAIIRDPTERTADNISTYIQPMINHSLADVQLFSTLLIEAIIGTT